MFFPAFDAQSLKIDDLIIIFSNVGIEYILNEEAKELAMSLDIDHFWENLADKLQFQNREITWIPFLQSHIGFHYENGSSTFKLLQLCKNKDITIGTFINALIKSNNIDALNRLVPLLNDIMQRYMRSTLNYQNKRFNKRILIQSTSCKSVLESLKLISFSLKVNGLIACIIIDSVSKEQINYWIKNVDFIVIVVTKDYNEVMKNNGNCTNGDRFHTHNMSMYAHGICQQYSSNCRNENGFSVIEKNCNSLEYKTNKISSYNSVNNTFLSSHVTNRSMILNETNIAEYKNNGAVQNNIERNISKSVNVNLINKKKQCLKTNFLSRLINKKNVLNNGDALSKFDNKPEIILLMNDCDVTAIPDEFSNSQKFNWTTDHRLFFSYLQHRNI